MSPNSGVQMACTLFSKLLKWRASRVQILVSTGKVCANSGHKWFVCISFSLKMENQNPLQVYKEIHRATKIEIALNMCFEKKI